MTVTNHDAMCYYRNISMILHHTLVFWSVMCVRDGRNVSISLLSGDVGTKYSMTVDGVHSC